MTDITVKDQHGKTYEFHAVEPDDEVHTEDNGTLVIKTHGHMHVFAAGFWVHIWTHDPPQEDIYSGI